MSIRSRINAPAYTATETKLSPGQSAGQPPRRVLAVVTFCLAAAIAGQAYPQNQLSIEISGQADARTINLGARFSSPSPRLGSSFEMTLSSWESLSPTRDNAKVKVRLAPTPAGTTLRIYRFDTRIAKLPADKNLRPLPCTSRLIGSSPVEIDLANLTCNSGDRLHKGGMIALSDGTWIVPISAIHDQKSPSVGSDLGVAVNILNRDGDDESFRFFDGASVYYSLTKLKTQRVRLIANLSALDFDEEVDFETGLGVGILFKPRKSTSPGSNLTFSFARGYNFMADESGDRWYTMIGFGWNFGRASSSGES